MICFYHRLGFSASGCSERGETGGDGQNPRLIGPMGVWSSSVASMVREGIREKSYYNEFNECDKQNIGRAMLDGISALQESLLSLEENEIILLVIARDISAASISLFRSDRSLLVPTGIRITRSYIPPPCLAYSLGSDRPQIAQAMAMVQPMIVHERKKLRSAMSAILACLRFIAMTIGIVLITAASKESRVLIGESP